MPGRGHAFKPGWITDLAERWSGGRWHVLHIKFPREAVPAAMSCVRRTCMIVGQSHGQLPRAWQLSGSRLLARQPLLPRGAAFGELDSVGCTTSSSCMAAGASIAKSGATAGLAEAWDGASWRITVTPHPASADTVLFSVSCADAARCLAVGSPVAGLRKGATLTLQWRRGRWHSLAITGHQIPGFVPGAVSCAAAARCEAVGYSLTNSQSGALTWNGKALRFLHVPAPAVGPLFAISCAKATRCVAVGGYANPSATTHNGALAELWTGTTWKLLPITG